MAATRNGFVIRFDESQLRPMSRSAHGVRAIKLRDGDKVVSLARVREGATVLTVTDRGLGKRVKPEDYRIQRRGGYGMLGYKVSDEKGHVCGIKFVDETDDIILISTDGQVIRIRACDIRVMGRYATGVKVMRVKDGIQVVDFTRAEHDETAEIEEVEQLSEEQVKAEEEAEAKAQSEEVLTDDAADDDETAEDEE